jgi:hypothetical protein
MTFRMGGKWNTGKAIMMQLSRIGQNELVRNTNNPGDTTPNQILALCHHRPVLTLLCYYIKKMFNNKLNESGNKSECNFLSGPD